MNELGDIRVAIPVVTKTEHMKRVEEWTQKHQRIKSPEQDHAAASQLVAEGVKLLDTRDRQIRHKPTTIGQTMDAITGVTEAERVFGAHFKNQNASKAFVKSFERRMNQKKAFESLILSSYPVLKSHKEALVNRGIHEIQSKLSTLAATVEPEPWEFRSSRSVKFSMKPNSENGSEKATLKQENDKEWWKWKLKRGFTENDDMLQKLALQRQKLEATYKQAQAQNPKREFADKFSPSLLMRNATNFQNEGTDASLAFTKPQPPRLHKPFPGMRDALKAESHGKKLTPLKKDPYLAKLLTGNETFNPETMIEVHPTNRRRELSQHFKAPTVGKRRISLESLPDSDDENKASKFFNRDVKVLYERLSELENVNQQIFRSREPSDGYLNLPILLATGRFNRYNKLPSMKIMDELSKKHQKAAKAGPGPNPRFKKGRLVSHETSRKPQPLLEELSTKEWAKKVVTQFTKQDHDGISDSDDGNISIGTYDKNIGSGGGRDILHPYERKRPGKPVDQETNLLYHDIMMAKWDKGKNETTAVKKTSKMRRDEYDKKRRSIAEAQASNNKTKGLEIWLENIREKAKRDRVISPGNHPVPSLVTAFQNASFGINA